MASTTRADAGLRTLAKCGQQNVIGTRSCALGNGVFRKARLCVDQIRCDCEWAW